MRLNRVQLRNILLREAQYIGSQAKNTAKDKVKDAVATSSSSNVKGKDEDIGKKLDDISARLKKLEEMLKKMMGKAPA